MSLIGRQARQAEYFVVCRVTSKWSTGTAISRKEKVRPAAVQLACRGSSELTASCLQYRLNDRLQLWPHWHMALHMPEVEG